MKQYKLVIFDLDGTLIDTSPGIINCYNYSAKLFNKKEIEPEKFNGIIGSPLPVGFKENFNMTDMEVIKAIKVYRKRYIEKGLYESVTYDGILDLLKKLKENNFILVVATLKLEKFAKILLKEKKLFDYFDEIYGTDEKDTYTKSDLINKALKKFNISNENAILIGDSKYDAEGAKKSKIDFLGVTYGLGYDTIKSVTDNYYTLYAETPFSIFDKIYKG